MRNSSQDKAEPTYRSNSLVFVLKKPHFAPMGRQSEHDVNFDEKIGNKNSLSHEFEEQPNSTWKSLKTEEVPNSDEVIGVSEEYKDRPGFSKSSRVFGLVNDLVDDCIFKCYFFIVFYQMINFRFLQRFIFLLIHLLRYLLYLITLKTALA